MYGEEDLAFAVIEQAIADTRSSSPYIKDEAIKFLTGKTKVWMNSLIAWCDIANVGEEKFNSYEIAHKYRKKFGVKANGK